MNFNIGDVANAFKLKAADSVAHGVQRVTEKAESAAKTLSDAAFSVGNAAKAATTAATSKSARTGKAPSGVAALVDPLQLWSSLTQQFQQIAASAMKDASRATALDATKNMAAGLAKEAVKAGKKMARGGATRRTVPLKTPRKTSTAKR